MKQVWILSGGMFREGAEFYIVYASHEGGRAAADLVMGGNHPEVTGFCDGRRDWYFQEASAGKIYWRDGEGEDYNLWLKLQLVNVNP